MSQPANVVGGYIVSMAIGLALHALLAAEWWSMGLAVGMVIATVAALRVTHPPVGANPLVVLLDNPGRGYIRITRCGWKFDACHDRAAVSPITAAHHLSRTGARVTINNWKMSPRPKLKPIPEDWYPCCTTAKALLPRMPYVSKRRSSAHSAGRCHRSSSINLHVVDSRFTRFNWIPILLVWSCTKISQHSFQENFEHGIFHGICPMHEK